MITYISGNKFRQWQAKFHAYTGFGKTKKEAELDLFTQLDLDKENRGKFAYIRTNKGVVFHLHWNGYQFAYDIVREDTFSREVTGMCCSFEKALEMMESHAKEYQ